MQHFKVTYTTDKGETYRTINVVAENLTCAYIYVGLKIPEADITEIESTDKIVIVKEK
jgi:hypothetical protein